MSLNGFNEERLKISSSAETTADSENTNPRPNNHRTGFMTAPSVINSTDFPGKSRTTGSFFPDSLMQNIGDDHSMIEVSLCSEVLVINARTDRADRADYFD